MILASIISSNITSAPFSLLSWIAIKQMSNLITLSSVSYPLFFLFILSFISMYYILDILFWLILSSSISPSVQFSSVAQSCLTLCDPINHSTPGRPVYHKLPEFTQTHVHQVSDAIQLSHPLSSPSPPAPNPSQHHGLFQWVNSSHEVAKVLEFQLQHQSFQSTPRTDLLQDGLVVSPCSPRDSQESSPTPQFKSMNFLALSFLHSPTLTSIHDHWKKRRLD